MTCVDMALAHHRVVSVHAFSPPGRKFALILLTDHCAIDFDATFLMQLIQPSMSLLLDMWAKFIYYIIIQMNYDQFKVRNCN